MKQSGDRIRSPRPSILFDLDGTLIDSVYQHVLAWREALERAGIELSVWRIHRRIGMSGGLFLKALSPETVREISPGEARNLQKWHLEAYAKVVSRVHPLPGAVELLAHLTQEKVKLRSQRVEGSLGRALPSKNWASERMFP